MSTPILYEEGTTDFWNMGLGPLSDATTTTVTEERNGEFVLDMTYPIDGVRATALKEKRIIVADAGHKLTHQQFDITDVKSNLTMITVHAEHVSYRLSRYPLLPSVSGTGDANELIKQWRNAIVVDNNFTADSDIGSTNSINWTIDKVTSARLALGGVDGSLLDVFGGEYRFDNEHVSLLNHRGSVVNTLLAYGRNITDFNQETAIDSTYTSIYPYATQSSTDSTAAKIITLPEYFVDGAYVDKYPQRRVAVIDLSSKFDEKNPVTVDGLRAAAQDYIKANNVGVPTVTTKISFVDLSKSANYADVAPLEQVDLCDEVPFWFSKQNINTTAKVSRVIWNVLNDSYDSIELGDLPATLSDSIKTIATTSASNVAQKTTLTFLQGANGIDGNFYTDGTTEPPVANKIGDRWYQKDGNDITMYIWDGTTWVRTASTKDAGLIGKQIKAATADLPKLKSDIEASLSASNLAVANAGFANDAADQAKSAAASAKSDAAGALAEATKSFNDAQNAISNATKAMDAAEQNHTTVTGLVTKVDDITGTIQTLATTQSVDKLAGTVTTVQNLAQFASDGLKLKADSSTVSSLDGRVTKLSGQLDIQADKIAATVTASDVTGMLGNYATQSWSQGQISAAKNEISASVETVQTQVNNSAVGTNLYTDTKSFGNLASWCKSSSWTKTANTYKKLDVVQTTYDWDGLSQYVQVKKGDILTYSVYAKYISGTGTSGIYWTLNGLTEGSYSTAEVDSGVTNVALTDSWQRVSGTTVATSDGYLRPRLERTNGNTNTMQIAGIKVEKGSKATDWSLAPEDQATIDWTKAQLDIKDNQITAQISDVKDGLTTKFTTLQQTLSGVQATANNAVTQGQLTLLSDQFTSTITGVKNDLNNMQIGGTNLIPNSSTPQVLIRPDQSPDYPAWVNTVVYRGLKNNETYTFSALVTAETADKSAERWGIRIFQLNGNHEAMKTNFDANTGKRQSVTFITPDDEISYDVYIYSGGVGVDYTPSDLKIVTTVSDYKLEQGNKATDWSPAPEDQATVADVSSQITQLQSDINLRVKTGDVVSQFNIDAGQALIQSNKLYLDTSTVVFSGKAFIPTAVIKDLSVDTFKGQTINGNTINVININGASIVSQSITADKLAANAIQVGLQNFSSTMKITPTSLTINNGAHDVFQLNQTGIHVWDPTNNKETGWIHSNTIVGHDNLFGLTFDLSHDAHFMSWAYRDDPNGTYTQKFSWLDTTAANAIGGTQGFHFSNDVNFEKGISITSAYQQLQFGTQNFNNINYPYLGSVKGTAGIAYGTSAIYVISGTTVYNLTDFIKSVNTLTKVGHLAIPTAIRSDGTVSNYTDFTF
ncbi:phage tail spike protein [Loigolactobacillus bifermentans]|uniref:Phage protein n=1 Tax=Loigolactobacillus bifermentans DSM 20003 TaxID=1423726 RepID=A0A0R1H3X0_9LACO|nr:phage tail spike protein [Loigolactobacillus bifermentans]KRK40888.1 phage protein [Loigolactobacillus bifermentans DSM 20003]QGG59641.1 hypothetical protein LB003_03610 [Loigolactobacillus bifermentans]